MSKKSKNSSKKKIDEGGGMKNAPQLLTAAQLELLEWDDLSSLIIDLELELSLFKNLLTDKEVAEYKRYIALCEDTKYDLVLQENEFIKSLDYEIEEH